MKTKLLAPLLLAISPALAADLAPDSIAGLTADAIILTGSGIFANSGAYRLTITQTAVAQTPITPNIVSQDFAYTYRKIGSQTAKIDFTDRATGATGVETLTFETSARASFSITTVSGSQTGKLVLEYAPPATALAPRLGNLSTRMRVVPGDVLTVGFVVVDAPKKLLIRAVGPTLATFGVTGVMSDPMLTVFQGTDVIVANDDWLVSSTAAVPGAFPLPLGSRDAAASPTLAPGAYTVQAKSANPQAGGEVLVEVYEVP